MGNTGTQDVPEDVVVSDLDVYSAAQTFNTQTDDYTLVLADAGVFVEMNKGTAVELTVPANADVAFPVGTRIDGIQLGAGQVTITPDGGVTLNYTPGNKTRAQYSAFSLVKKATNTWHLVGDLSA